jgi:hypothetical protein
MDNNTQLDRFKEAARKLGCDEDEAAFDEKLRVIAKQKPRALPPIDKPNDAVGAKKQHGGS